MTRATNPDPALPEPDTSMAGEFADLEAGHEAADDERKQHDGPEPEFGRIGRAGAHQRIGVGRDVAHADAHEHAEHGPGHDGEAAPELEPEGMHVGRRAADHGIEHHVQETLEVLKLVVRDLRRHVRIDGLRGELHRKRFLRALAVERRDLEQKPFPERGTVLQRGVLHRPGKGVGAHPALAPLGELFEAREFGKPGRGSPARPPGGRAPGPPPR